MPTLDHGEQHQWGRQWVEERLQTAASEAGVRLDRIEWASGNVHQDLLIVVVAGKRLTKAIDIATLADLHSAADDDDDRLRLARELKELVAR